MAEPHDLGGTRTLAQAILPVNHASGITPRHAAAPPITSSGRLRGACVSSPRRLIETLRAGTVVPDSAVTLRHALRSGSLFPTMAGRLPTSPADSVCK
jgi:hypothetical protein